MATSNVAGPAGAAVVVVVVGGTVVVVAGGLVVDVVLVVAGADVVVVATVDEVVVEGTLVVGEVDELAAVVATVGRVVIASEVEVVTGTSPLVDVVSSPTLPAHADAVRQITVSTIQRRKSPPL